NLLGVTRFLRWVEAKMISIEVEGGKWRRLLLQCSDPYSATCRLKGVKSGELIGNSSKMVTSIPVTGGTTNIANALSRTVDCNACEKIDGGGGWRVVISGGGEK
nr:hypothetical protein [Tanacetum cinerariifolium]